MKLSLFAVSLAACAACANAENIFPRGDFDTAAKTLGGENRPAPMHVRACLSWHWDS